jgi:hypothetical protein
MSFNSLMTALSQQRIARAGLGLLVLAVAAIVQYKLAYIPQPVNLDTTGKFSPATIKRGQENLIIEGPSVNSSEGVLFSHDGKPNEIVNVTFERARLDEQTIEMFGDGESRPPAITAEIVYRTDEPTPPPIGEESCRTQVELRAASKMPDEIQLFQLGDPGLERYRHLEMRTKGTELTSQLVISSPGGSYNEPGCQKQLKVGDWKKSIASDVTTIVAENSNLRFRFQPLTTNASLWDGPDGLFEPFDLGAPQVNPTDPPSFQARAVSIRSLSSVNTPSTSPALLSARSMDDGPPLTISGLKIGSDQLQLSVAGKGWVQVDGEDVTLNLLDRVQEHPIPAALLGAANGALLAWVARLILQSPAPPPKPKSPQRKARTLKVQRKRKSGKKK